MSKASWDDVKKLFDEMIALPDEERGEFLDEACADDDRLRVELEALAASHSELQDLSPETVTKGPAAGNEGPGTVIGRYKLLQEIGEGGFGTVYMAEQERPVRRRVALKVIKLGMDTKQVIARFEAERQALALMEHPNIARVLDAGATTAGRPYFVMELVRGVPITEYCDQNKLGTRQRLELFMLVCGAVQHAHQKGIIHRDIKPTNVLVTLHDGQPVPKIIDFGIAKATNQRLTERTLFTEFRQFIGTPAYMSPEQAEMSGLDVDTRSDVYSLGVLLYELLTGTTPLDSRRLRRVGYSEIQRIIREEEPHKPSARISTMGGEATTAAEHRRTDLPGLTKILRGDLDWIVMMALEKDRTRRYDTANGMRRDIERYLADEPVSACPPSAVYRIGKFLRRNRTGVAVGGAVALALVIGLVLSAAGFLQARHERAVARSEAEASRAINAFFSDMLASVDPQQLRQHSGFAPERTVVVEPETGFDRDVSVAEMMLRGSRQIGDSFAGKPDLEATARETIGLTLLGLGRRVDAVPELEAAARIRRESLGPDHPSTLRAQLQYSHSLTAGGRVAEAEPLLRDTIQRMERLYGARDPRTLHASSLLATALVEDRRHSESDPIFRATLEGQREVLGEEHRDTLFTMLMWAGSYHWRGRGADGEALTRPAHAIARRTLSPDDFLTLRSQSMLGWSYNFQGKQDRGEELLRPAVDGLKRILGDQHPVTCGAKMGLGRSLRGDEHADEKEQLWREALDGLRASEGRASPSIFVISRDLAFFLLNREKNEEGIELLRRGVEDFREEYGESHSWTLTNMNYLSDGLQRVGRSAEARDVLEQKLDAIERQQDPQDLATAEKHLYFAEVFWRLGRTDEARNVAAGALEIERSLAGAEEADAETLNAYAWSLLTCHPPELRDPSAALPVAERAAELAPEEDRAGILDTLALALARNGRSDEAVETQRQALALLPADDMRLRGSYVVALVSYVLGSENVPEARRILIEHLGLLERGVDGSADRFDDLVGKFSNELLDEMLFEQAEIVLLEALDITRARFDADPASVGDLLNHLSRVLHRLGREREAVDPLRESIAAHLQSESKGGLTRSQIALARTLIYLGQVDEGEHLAREAYDRAVDSWGKNSQLAMEAWRDVGLAQLARGAAAAAEPKLRTVSDWYWVRAFRRPDPWRRAGAESALGECLSALGRFEEAESLLLRSQAVLESELGSANTQTRVAGRRLARLYEDWGKPSNAERWATWLAGASP